MSVILLSEMKELLQVIHDRDDGRIQLALNAAEAEALKIMNRKYLPTVDDPEPPEDASENYSELDPMSENETASEASAEIEPDVKLAIYIMTRANYDDSGVAAARARAETLLSPHRKGLGV